MPAHGIKWYLDEVDEWLRDEKENENFEGSVERFFAVYYNEDGWQNPPFWCDSDIVK